MANYLHSVSHRIYQRFYNNLSWAYDFALVVLSGGLWYRWVLMAAWYADQEPVVEVGCGRGRLLAELARRGKNAIGFDSSPQMVAASRHRLAKSAVAVEVHVALAQQLPLEDNSVGTIITTNAPFIDDEATWREFARVLRPGGRWVNLVGGAPPYRWRAFGLLMMRLANRRNGIPRREVPLELFGKQQSGIIRDGKLNAWAGFATKLPSSD